MELNPVLEGISRGDTIGGPTALASLLWSSLCDLDAFDPSDIVERYMAWWNREGFDTGPTAGAVFNKISQGTPIDEAVAKVDFELAGQTAGIGPAHRNTVLAAASFLSFDELGDCARIEARLTHAHPLAGDVAAASCEIARMLLEGNGWLRAINNTQRRTKGDLEAIIGEWMRPPSDQSGFSLAVFHAALHFVGTSSSFNSALERSCLFSGTGNYAPVLTGALAAARWEPKT